MKKHRFGLVSRRESKGYLFLLPWIAGFLIFFAVPLVQSFYYSLSTVKMTAAGRVIAYVGLDNYIKLFTENVIFTERLGEFWSGIVLNLLVILVFSLLIAMLINQKIRGRGFFRTLFFLPIIVVSGPVLQRLMDENATTVPLIQTYGVIGMLSSTLPAFLAEPVANLFGQLILILWYSGVPILIFLTGLQKVDRSLYEAALIDGASNWVVFWKITLPSLRSVVMINGVYTLVFLATGGVNRVLSYIKYMMFDKSGGYGPASAMSWVYTLSVGLGLLVIWLITRERKIKVTDEYKTRKQIELEKRYKERASQEVK